MVAASRPVTFHRYHAKDYEQVASLWTRINRELAPAGMESLFEQYIATTIDGELKNLPELFAEARRNPFWVIEAPIRLSVVSESKAAASPTPSCVECTWMQATAARASRNACSIM